MSRFHSRTGLTVLELLIAVVLLSVVMGGVFNAADRGIALFNESSVRGDVTMRSSRTIHRIAKEMRAIWGNTLVPDLFPPAAGGPNIGNREVEFRSADSYAAGAVNGGSPTKIQWEMEPTELDNGIDDDGDGLVDEGLIVLLRNFGLGNEIRVVLANGVREFLEGEVPGNNVDENGNGLIDEPGFTLDRVGDEVTIRLSLERIGLDGRPVVRTQQTSITLRN